MEISGVIFRAVETAARELNRHGLEIEKYKIVVETTPTKILVSFQDPARKRGQLGSGPNLVGFYVELDADTLQIIDSAFSK